RDFHVTGVQTCALPICAASGSGGSPSRPRRQSFENRSSLVDEEDLNASTIQQPDVSGASLLFTPHAEVLFQFTIRVPEKGVQYRSEERRVGKECRCRCT